MDNGTKPNKIIYDEAVDSRLLTQYQRDCLCKAFRDSRPKLVVSVGIGKLNSMITGTKERSND